MNKFFSQCGFNFISVAEINTILQRENAVYKYIDTIYSESHMYIILFSTARVSCMKNVYTGRELVLLGRRVYLLHITCPLLWGRVTWRKDLKFLSRKAPRHHSLGNADLTLLSKMKFGSSPFCISSLKINLSFTNFINFKFNHFYSFKKQYF